MSENEKKDMSAINSTVLKARTDFRTNNTRMSISELSHLYKSQEIILNPNFQRIFRWNNIQKSRFIESVFLGIPFPPIFVSQDKSGTWTVIDGVQRLSSILQFLGELGYSSESREDEDSGTKDTLQAFDKLSLSDLKKLKILNNLTWSDLDLSLQRIFKRATIEIILILSEDEDSLTGKFELFQRLNTGGSSLSAQEIRNCLIIMEDENFFNELNKFKTNEKFETILSISKDKSEKDFTSELILKYLIAKNRNTLTDKEREAITLNNLGRVFDVLLFSQNSLNTSNLLLNFTSPAGITRWYNI